MAKSTASRVPTTITIDPKGNAVVQPSQTFAPLRPQVFKDNQLTNTAALARQLNTMQQVIHDATVAARSNGRNLAQTFEGVTFTFGSPVSLTHGFGTKVRWSLVRVYAVSLGVPVVYEPANSQSDNNTIVLEAVAGSSFTADVEVWGA